MKNTFKYIAVILLGVLALNSCIKETIPEGGTVTAKQLTESASALDASLAGIPAQFATAYPMFGSDNQLEPDCGLPQYHLEFCEIMGDIFVQGSNSGYDWFNRWNRNKNMDQSTWLAQVPWYTLYSFVKSANDVIAAIGDEPENDIQKAYSGMARTIRAMEYMMLMSMYEPVENPYTDVSDVKGLTVPYIDEKFDAANSNNNPRIPHDELVKHIQDDLAIAEEYLKDYTPASKMYPTISVVYGLKARLAMVEHNWKDAETYARKAIDTSKCTPINQEQWENPNTGFCRADANPNWMWYVRYSVENMSNLCNWTGWVAQENDWGYGSLCYFGINKWMYNRINDTDFRKHSWIDPDKSLYYKYQCVRGKDWIEAETTPALTALKFRCVGGNWQDYTVGGVSDMPIMRVEEMYFIEAEAKGMQNLANGEEALKNFMTKYRDPAYTIDATKNITKGIVKQGASYLTPAEYVFVEELFFQKRIEFWMEGMATFADYKRIQPGNYQWYEGSNAPGLEYHLNCDYVKPNCNYVIPQAELNSNPAIKNNPDPSDKVKPID